MIFDCFPFFNENDLVHLRLNELYNIVDYFVISEANQTHSGQPKPYCFDHERFYKCKDKIIYLEVDNLPCNRLETPEPADHWNREKHQRDSLLRGLKGIAGPDDLVIVSDCDEIPKGSTISTIKLNHGEIGSLIQDHFQYYFNLKGREPWTLGKVLNYSTLLELKCPSDLRNTNVQHRFIPGGWHYSYMGGLDAIKQKLESFAHQEFNRPEVLDLNNLRAKINSGMYPWELPLHEGRDEPCWQFTQDCPIPEMDVEFTKYDYDNGCLRKLGELVPKGPGKIIDYACFEGWTTIYLANKVYPETVYAVGEWNANFVKNMKLTSGNVEYINSHDFLNNCGHIKFIHLNRASLEVQADVVCGYGTKEGNVGPLWFNQNISDNRL